MEDEDQNSACWVKLSVPLDKSCKNKDDVQFLLEHWWMAAGINAVPLAHVSFVDSLITNACYVDSPTTRIPTTLEYIKRKLEIDLAERVYIVFYAVVSIDNTIRVLGAYPSDLLPKYLSISSVDPLTIGDLLRTPEYDYIDALRRNGVNMGSQSASMWFYLPFRAPDDEEHGISWSVSMDHVTYRAQLMNVFWKQRSNPTFLEGDGCAMLKYLHTAQGTAGAFFDLNTERGRKREHASYWALTFACAHEPVLWDIRQYFERVLLEFRVQVYFCKERHFLLLIQKNKLYSDTTTTTKKKVIVSDKGKEEEDDIPIQEESNGATEAMVIGQDNDDIIVEEEEQALFIRDIQSEKTISARDKSLYRQRHPNGPLPSVWLAVPFSTAGSEITSSPLYDIDGGHVYITHKDFSVWVWHQMDNIASLLTRHIYMARRTCVEIGNGDDDGESNVLHLLDVVLLPSLINVKSIEDEMREKRKATLPAGNDIISFDIGTIEGLIALAMKYMPLCMARHVFFAMERERHPKNGPRVSFVKFLLDAGYQVEDIDRAMFLMYSFDKEYIRKEHGGKWDEETYKRTFGKEVANMHKTVVVQRSIGPYGCNTLVTAGTAGAEHGCPFAKENNGEAKLLLRWIEPSCQTLDIEDIMRSSKFPQEKCCRDFAQRRTECKPIIVKHPNNFFRGGYSANNGNLLNNDTKRIKTEQPAAQVKMEK